MRPGSLVSPKATILNRARDRRYCLTRSRYNGWRSALASQRDTLNSRSARILAIQDYGATAEVRNWDGFVQLRRRVSQPRDSRFLGKASLAHRKSLSLGRTGTRMRAYVARSSLVDLERRDPERAVAERTRPGSPRDGYRWLARHRAGHGVSDHSSAPRCCPHRLRPRSSPGSKG